MDDGYLLELQNEIHTTLINEEPRITNPIVTLEADRDQLLLRVTVEAELTFDPNVTLELETLVRISGNTNA
jgi:predicted component of type VI protein secretion system